MDPTGNEEAIQLRVEQWPFITMPSRLVVQRGISDAAKVTYAALSLWGGMDGKAFPSRDKLADARGVKRSTVYKHLQDLESAGWISREQKEMPNGAVVSIITVKRGPDIGTGGSNNLDGGVQISGLGGPDIGTHKDKRKEKSKYKYTHPYNLSSEQREKDNELQGFALKISRVYPHGWGNGGTRHAPGLTKVKGVLLGLPRKEWDVILDAAREYGRALKGNEDQQFAPALWRWVEAETWKDMSNDPFKEDSSEGRALSAEDIAEARRQAQIKQAASVGVTLDPVTLEVTDWGPQGPPNKKQF